MSQKKEAVIEANDIYLLADPSQRLTMAIWFLSGYIFRLKILSSPAV